jgi:hypothetical protein
MIALKFNKAAKVFMSYAIPRSLDAMQYQSTCYEVGIYVNSFFSSTNQEDANEAGT